VKGVVAVGGSAGGVEAMVDLMSGLPSDLRGCVLVTLHIGAGAHSRLPQILTRAGPLPAEHAEDGRPLEPGRILVAPPDRHLLVVDGRVRLSSGPRINRHRPAVDAMFAGAARWAGPRAVGIVLSGALDDGAIGAALITRAGGQVLAQDPAEASFPSMPRAAMAAAPHLRTAPARSLGAVAADVLIRMPGAVDREEIAVSTEPYAGDDVGFLSPDETRLTRLACPECGGALAQGELGDISFFRCHVGHQYSLRGLEAAQRDSAEAKLWAATAALEEHAVVARHLANTTSETSPPDYRQTAKEAWETARMLRGRLHQRAGSRP
jgi:two-component system, chemotaxis family, protein-glutamate methylesterase/glutaminase